MNNNFMRVIVFFDLPVTTREERRVATQFRNYLLRDGYYMIQFSVYGRLCGNREAVQMHIGRLMCHVPSGGSVRVMSVTEKQYTGMIILAGTPKNQEKPADYVQMSFF